MPILTLSSHGCETPEKLKDARAYRAEKIKLCAEERAQCLSLPVGSESGEVYCCWLNGSVRYRRSATGLVRTVSGDAGTRFSTRRLTYAV